MLKKLSLLLLAVLLCFAMVACGDDPAPTPDDPTPDQHEHTLVKTEANAATCTENGNNAYWTCSGCNKVYADAAATTETTVAAQTLTATGHDFANADCDTPKTCHCGATEGEALGHDYDETTWGYKEADGHAYECNRCDNHSTVTPHTPSADAATEDAAVVCTVCGYEIAPRLDHTHTADTEWLSNGEYHWNACVDGCAGVELNKARHEGTDDNDCTTATVCSTCNKTLVEAETEHAYDNACDTTCNNDGCNHTRTVGEDAHVYDNACDANCNNAGCNHTRTPADHVDENPKDGNCDNCGIGLETDDDGGLLTPPHEFG